jgi:hypothetical protein
MGDTVPPVLSIAPEGVEHARLITGIELPGGKPDPQPGGKGYIGGLPATEVRRIRAKARRYNDGRHAEFVKDAKLRMYEHALKLEALTRYAEDAIHASQCAAAYRKAVLDIVAMHTPEKGKK